MATKIFVNLPVKNLNRSVEFFTKLGFKFNPQFTDETATCMIVSEDIFVMLWNDPMRLLILSTVMLLLAACAPPERPDIDLKTELEAMFDTDQAYRNEMQNIALKHGSNSPEVIELWKKQQAIDEANIKRLGEIIETHGWPGRRVVGDKAAIAAFLVVQHAEYAHQKQYLPLLRAAVAGGEARAEDLALLEDRVLMREGKKQLYGSQLQEDGKGGWEFYPIEDERNVDKRRKAVGLPLLAEYAKRFGFEYHPK
jgi:hypothetical protein